MRWRTWYSVFSAGPESLTKKVLSEMLMEQKPNISASVLTLIKAMEAFWIPGPLYHQGTRASVVTPRLYIHKRQFLQSQNLLSLIWSSHSSSSQVNTARLRLMNVVPSPVSTMEHVLTYRGATHAGVLQVCGHVMHALSVFIIAPADLLNSSVAWSGRPGWLW